MPKAKKTGTTKAKTTVAAAASKIASAVTKKTEDVKAKKASASTEAVVRNSIILQYADKNVSYDDLIQNAKNKYQYDMGGDPASVKKIELFVKPEENKVYFVLDDEIQGNYDL